MNFVTVEMNEYVDMEQKIKELEAKLEGYKKMRDELLDMNKIKSEKLAIAVDALSECHQVMTESWPDRNITVVTGEALEKIKQ